MRQEAILTTLPRLSTYSSTRNIEMLVPLLTVLFVAFYAPLSQAQWDSTEYNYDDVIFTGGFQIVEDDGTNIRAFSAMGQTWLTLAPSSAEIVDPEGDDYPDWASLIKQADGTYLAYSARFHDFAILDPVDPDPEIYIEDDVILVVQYDCTTGGYIASAYSAQTNEWQDQAVADPPVLIRTSRFVAGFAIDNPNIPMVYGFGARAGQWNGDNFQANRGSADGNILCYEDQNFSGGYSMEADVFSGVLNTWDPSPPCYMSDFSTVIDHNVALTVTDQWFPVFYSAYRGDWTISPNPLDYYTTNFDLHGDNWILIDRNPGLGSPPYEAFGARPGNTIAWLVGGPYTFLGASEDVVVVTWADGTLAFAFSGLRNVSWQMRAYTSPVRFCLKKPDDEAPDHSVVLADGAGQFHAFSPAHETWAPVLSLADGVYQVDDAVAVVDNDTERWAYSARWNEWVAGPAKEYGATYNSYIGGSVYCDYKRAGASGVGEIVYFDERRNSWSATTELGERAFLHADRNLMTASDLTPSLCGYSAQRGDWVAAPSAVSLDFGRWDENVAWYVDDNAMLHAFGSPADTHIWYGWPLDTEYQTCDTASVRFSIRGTQSWEALLVASRIPYFPGMAYSTFGNLYLLTPILFVEPASDLVGADNLAEGIWGPPGVTIVIQIWSQGACVEPGGDGKQLIGNVPEPIWFF